MQFTVKEISKLITGRFFKTFDDVWRLDDTKEEDAWENLEKMLKDSFASIDNCFVVPYEKKGLYFSISNTINAIRNITRKQQVK